MPTLPDSNTHKAEALYSIFNNNHYRPITFDYYSCHLNPLIRSTTN
ncbi:MAG: hypothetical protein KAI83_04985 [Thiomargarita sp.]|nr:hypothetical protein [Thiomargarita sp.]